MCKLDCFTVLHERVRGFCCLQMTSVSEVPPAVHYTLMCQDRISAHRSGVLLRVYSCSVTQWSLGIRSAYSLECLKFVLISEYKKSTSIHSLLVHSI